MRKVDPEVGFAGVYDLIYDGPAGFYEAQLDTLRGHLEQGQRGPRRLLDAGCGTGRQMAALAAAGHQVVGLDASRAMLGEARRRLAAASLPVWLVHADLRGLPWADARFDGAYCLESPLAYLLGEEDLHSALAGLRRALRSGGLLVVDVLDYAATVGPDGTPPQTHHFPTAGGQISVRESHTPDLRAGSWHMRQEFVVHGAAPISFMVEHIFSLRNSEDYCAAVEAAGFRITHLMERYPGSPPEVAYEQRTIILAERKA